MIKIRIMDIMTELLSYKMTGIGSLSYNIFEKKLIDIMALLLSYKMTETGNV
jgi:hypothetical protein